jgi:hypothetical protein
LEEPVHNSNNPNKKKEDKQTNRTASHVRRRRRDVKRRHPLECSLWPAQVIIRLLAAE